MDELLAVTVRPKDAPARSHRFRNGFCQGFAPFGLHPVLGCETNLQAPAATCGRTLRPRAATTAVTINCVTRRQSSEAVFLLRVLALLQTMRRRHPPPPPFWLAYRREA